MSSPKYVGSTIMKEKSASELPGGGWENGIMCLIDIPNSTIADKELKDSRLAMWFMKQR